eukprot:10638752-Prorocentrum_lima.AAC.1
MMHVVASPSRLPGVGPATHRAGGTRAGHAVPTRAGPPGRAWVRAGAHACVPPSPPGPAAYKLAHSPPGEPVSP